MDYHDSQGESWDRKAVLALGVIAHLLAYLPVPIRVEAPSLAPGIVRIEHRHVRSLDRARSILMDEPCSWTVIELLDSAILSWLISRDLWALVQSTAAEGYRVEGAHQEVDACLAQLEAARLLLELPEGDDEG